MVRIFAAAALAALALPAAAQATSPWYVGIAGGQAKTSKDLVSNRESTITNASDISTRFDDTDTAWRGFVGYRFTPWLALELDYADLGSHSTDTRFLGGDAPAPAQVVINREIKGYGIDAVLSVPVANRFSLFGRAGAFRAQLDASAQLAGNVVFTGGNGETFRSTRLNETVTRFGAGLDMTLAPNVDARLEWTRYLDVGKKFEVGGSGTTGEADTDTWMLGVVFRF